MRILSIALILALAKSIYAQETQQQATGDFAVPTQGKEQYLAITRYTPSDIGSGDFHASHIYSVKRTINFLNSDSSFTITSTTPTPTTTQTAAPKELTGGAIAGISIGGFVGMVMIIIVVIIYVEKGKGLKPKKQAMKSDSGLYGHETSYKYSEVPDLAERKENNRRHYGIVTSTIEGSWE
ncbi:hypothetical protein N0V90_005055 [Kalmusia sp. IMI 367209]|nr:hypothetical protein N0V90_005055 [Kalmusia sp. IMI 367209]